MIGSVILAAVVLWLLVTALSQRSSHWADAVRRSDVLHLIPSWTFFAPAPGRADYHLIHRESASTGGSPAAWRSVTLHRSRSTFYWIWFPEKRANKVVSDVVQALRLLQVEGLGLTELQYSVPYLALLNYVHAEVTPGCRTYQFGVVESTGHSQRALTPVFLSGSHVWDGR